MRQAFKTSAIVEITAPRGFARFNVRGLVYIPAPGCIAGTEAEEEEGARKRYRGMHGSTTACWESLKYKKYKKKIKIKGTQIHKVKM